MDSLYSSSWYRIADLRPRLSHDACFHLHRYRGEDWYVVRSRSTGRVHRLVPAAHRLIASMDGERTVQAIWDEAVTRCGDEAPTQDEVIELLGLLHGAGLLRGDVAADTAALFRRSQDRERAERRSKLNPIALRVPLFDPDDFLERWLPFVRPLFTSAGAAAWCVLVAVAGVAALRHAPELGAAGSSLFEPQGILAFWFAYPVVKALHELGHAFAVKRWGGEVREIGVLFLVFMPVPYVDASASAVFVDKRHRMLVGAAGIVVELALAALATLVWITVEPGVVRHVAYAVMVVGGLSTVVFNGNPLLRFDGYYVLADAIEIPNLAAKANRYTGAWAKRLLLGLDRTPLPETARGEPAWLLGYAVASYVCRITVLLGIALFLADRFFVLGMALALGTLLVRLVWPVLRQLAFVLTDPGVGERRGRAVAGVLSLAAVAGGVLFVLPLPLHTRGEGVVWLPEKAHVRSGAEGFVTEVLAVPHQDVSVGDPLIRVLDPLIESRLRVLEAERDELWLRMHALSQEHRVQSEIAREQLADAEAALARAREHAGEVLIRSPANGLFVMADGRDPVGRYVRQGEVVAYVVDLASATARVVVSQEDAALLRERTRSATLRLAHDLGEALPARITREVPAASDRLPTPVLGTAGGGPFAVDPSDPEGLRTLEAVFQFELEAPLAAMQAVGERVYVRFDHGSEPVGQRAWRSLRRLFLRQIGV